MTASLLVQWRCCDCQTGWDFLVLINFILERKRSYTFFITHSTSLASTSQFSFGLDETGLYWRAVPEGMLAFKNYKNVSYCCLLATWTDQKLDPLVTGKSKNRHCFKDAKKNCLSAIKQARMWRRPATSGKLGWRNLTVTQRSACISCYVSTVAPNVKVVFLPPNTMSLIQPMDQSIIANFTQHYRSLVPRQLKELSRRLTKTTAQMACLRVQKEAWSRITQTTIINCYRRASFTKQLETRDSKAVTRRHQPACAVGQRDSWVFWSVRRCQRWTKRRRLQTYRRQPVHWPAVGCGDKWDRWWAEWGDQCDITQRQSWIVLRWFAMKNLSGLTFFNLHRGTVKHP